MIIYETGYIYMDKMINFFIHPLFKKAFDAPGNTINIRLLT